MLAAAEQTAAHGCRPADPPRGRAAAPRECDALRTSQDCIASRYAIQWLGDPELPTQGTGEAVPLRHEERNSGRPRPQIAPSPLSSGCGPRS
mgnify:CR=1 FL=1